MNKPNQQSIREVRDLLAGLHPRRPEEVMGESITSSLLQNTVTAALAWTGLLVVGTVIVFALGGTPIGKRAEKMPSETQANALGTAAADPTPNAADAALANDAESPEKDPTAAAVDAMGIGDASDPDADANPLEDRLDQLLDGLE